MRRIAAVAACLLLSACGGNTAASSRATFSCNQQQQVGSYAITFTLRSCPAQPGQKASVAIGFKDASGQAVTGAKVTVLPDMPSMRMAGDTLTAAADTSGYRADVLFGMSGIWRINVTVTPPAGSPVQAHFMVNAE